MLVGHIIHTIIVVTESLVGNNQLQMLVLVLILVVVIINNNQNHYGKLD
jgi:hypothetical protein